MNKHSIDHSLFLKPKRCLLLLVLTALVWNDLKAQRYNNWLFGFKAYVTFNTGINPPPRAVSGSVMTTNEGSCAISDENGNLLFYSHGKTIYNKQHQVMANGDDLAGHQSAAQAAVIVAMPGQDSLYYVFTTNALENNYQGGYTYSIVNINRNNGLGEVVLKNQMLYPSCSERLTATYHANGSDIWIITNDESSNIFRAWQLTCTGLNLNPVVSTVGEVMNEFIMNVGSMKVSPDGKKLCQTHYPLEFNVVGPDRFFQLFDFDNATGQLTNPKKVLLPTSNAYNCEFSPDSRLLYITEPMLDRIEQVEVNLPTAAAIAASHVAIPAKKQIYGIQLGPDKKIYINYTENALGVIESPNVKGVGCRFVADKVQMGASGRAGLPFVLTPLTPDVDRFGYSVIDGCNGRIQFYAPQDVWGSAEWSWDFGDGNTSTLQDPIHVFSPANQLYQVKLKITSPFLCGYVLRSVTIAPQGSLAKAGFDFVAKCDSLSVRFLNKSVYTDTIKYEWFFGDGNVTTAENPTHTYTDRQLFSVKLRIQNEAGTCYLDSITKTINLEPFQVNVSPGMTIEEGQTVQLSVDQGVRFKWSPSTWLNVDTVQRPTARPLDDILYTVTSTNALGCTDKDSVRINVKQFADIYVPTAFTPNGDQRNSVFYPFVGGRFTLQNFSVFTRWGEVVFSTNEKLKGWDGTLKGKALPAGVYVWVVKAKDKNGKPVDKKGTVLLIR